MARTISPVGVLAVSRAFFTRPFKWGLRTDCTAACVIFHSLHGVDPLAGCQEVYGSSYAACRIALKAGGYHEWCRANIALPNIEDPGPGDLALISSRDPLGAALAICIQPGDFAAKTETGMAISRQAAIMEAWTWHF